MLKILFFGRLKDMVGSSEIEVNKIKNIKELKEYIFEKYPNLKEEVFFVSVNRKIVNKNVDLKDGDEIAFLPPISGG